MKKGFTLIELLAVIVVLAIIALIVTPVISKIIEGAKQRSSVTSAQNYIDSVNNIYALSMIDSNYEYLKDKTVLETGFDDNELSEIEISGKKPSYIKIEYDKSKNRVKEGKFCVDGTSVDYINGVATKSENDYCHKEAVAGLYDKDNNLLVSWDSLINDYGMDLNWRANNAEVYYYANDSWRTARTGAAVDINNITSSQPAVVFAKNDFTGAKKLVLPASLGEVSKSLFTYLQAAIDIIIPKGITSIGAYAFEHAMISGVTLNDEITSIGAGAFDYTTNLKKFIIPDSVTEFGMVSDLTNPSNGLYFSGVEYVKIGKGMTVLPNYFCHYCKNLKSIDIPSNIKKIGMYAFDYSGLESITLHEGLEEIGPYSFEHSNSLKSINIPNSVTTMGSMAFAYTGVETVTISEGDKPTVIGKDAFDYAHLKGKLVIPSSVKLVSEGAFDGLYLDEVYVDAENIGTDIQYENYSSIVFHDRNELQPTLKKVTFGPNVKNIGKKVLLLTSGLEEVKFEDPTNWTLATSCTAVDVSTTAKVKTLMTNNSNLLPALRHWNSLSECQ